jgi:pimeloyl-ACP methyl ester carboxylesterase
MRPLEAQGAPGTIDFATARWLDCPSVHGYRKGVSSSITPTRSAFALEHGITIAADIYGDRSRPTVLFLHGGTAEALAAEGYCAITMDHRGHGESSWDPEGHYEGDDFATDLEAVLLHHVDRPILVGASLGGIAALLAQHRHTHPICRGVVLVDVTPRLNREGVLRILSFMHHKPDGFGSLEEVAEAIASYLPHRKRPTSLKGLEKNLRRREDGRYVWHWDPKLLETWSPGRHDDDAREHSIRTRLEAAAAVEVPMMLVRGRMSDVVSEENAKELLAIAPRTEYVDLAGAAHMVAGDRNDAFTKTVLDFVKRTYRATAA